ncbi:MAG: hypothetical protein ACTHKQ_12415 [Mesorhizobium sp.]
MRQGVTGVVSLQLRREKVQIFASGLANWARSLRYDQSPVFKKVKNRVKLDRQGAFKGNIRGLVS